MLLSLESKAPSYFRKVSDSGTLPLGSCKSCPRDSLDVAGGSDSIRIRSLLR